MTALRIFNSACSSLSPTINYSYPPLDIHFIQDPSLRFAESVSKLFGPRILRWGQWCKWSHKSTQVQQYISCIHRALLQVFISKRHSLNRL
jgi:hypothetical protein